MNLTGHAAGTTKVCKYRMIGKMCHLHLRLVGTATGGTTKIKFDLPVDVGDYADSSFVVCLGTVFTSQSTGGNSIGYIGTDPDTSEHAVTIYRDASGTAWTAAESAIISGDLFFRADAIP
jgi:hypothetical protein